MKRSKESIDLALIIRRSFDFEQGGLYRLNVLIRLRQKTSDELGFSFLEEQRL
ncbi:MAG: hypothetical protein JSU63_01650 [Phycisphaerales bacterium]|nr:MAG: hypothetical protein JSU63_01650 [Phycisphaerales bacterium]